MLKKLSAVFAVSMFALTAAACASKGDCEKVVAHTIELMVKGLPEEVKQETVKNIEKERADLVKRCEEADPPLSKEAEKCALAAESLPDLTKCMKR